MKIERILNFLSHIENGSLAVVFCLAIFFSCSQAQNGQMESGKPNGLINETSPYLLQHAYNPVNWQPWGDNALEKAQRENKMMVISIGYSSCHWCHVMEKESFSDSTVAHMMNDTYISLKVDREERPDVDQVYMDASMLLTGSGGWPLNVIALPDGRPVFAGTYFPKDNWIQVLEYFKDAFENDRATLMSRADQLMQGISSLDKISFDPVEKTFEKSAYTELYPQIIFNLDLRKGGRKGAPKFPTPVVFESLLEFNYHMNKKAALDAVTTTLDRIAAGGIYDHLGGGFARYSTDADWKVPHFEKMLYDNAQLISLYSKAYRQTGTDRYKEIVFETIDFINREMRDESGGFYSSFDADSEGEEGKYYVWLWQEINTLLKEDADLFSEHFNIEEGGNWEDGKNILYTDPDGKRIVQQSGLSGDDYHEKIAELKAILLRERRERVPPPLDDKILTAWNGLMITGMVEAYFAFNDQEYLTVALATGNFILREQKRPDGGLNRNFKDGNSTINAFLDDYAFSIQGFINLYQATFDEKWLREADKLLAYVKEHFINDDTKMFYYTSDEDNPLIVRKTELPDNVIPASNSTIAHSLYQLGHYLYRQDDIDHAAQMLKNMTPQIEENPYYYMNWISLLAKFTYPYYEVAIVGEESATSRNRLLKTFIPNLILMGGTDEGTLELLENKLVNGRTMIYVCENKVCRLPVDAVDRARQLISNE